MFAINMTLAPQVRSYDDACRVLCRAMKDTTTWARYGEEFPIPGKKYSPMSVRATESGIRFRYHVTDVIEWHRDNSYTLRPWGSLSTCTFFNQFCPRGHYLTRNGCALVIDDKAYPLSGGAVHVAGGEPTGDLGVFIKKRVDRKLAKEALSDTNYHEYRQWHKLFYPMLEFKTSGFYWRDSEIFEILEDRDRWVKLATGYPRDGSPAGVRKAIYDWTDCYYHEEIETVPAKALSRFGIQG